jgi:hypothetical protein
MAHTKRLLGYNNEAAPRQGPLFFLCFSRGSRTQPKLARVPLLYVPFDFFLVFFFMIGPLSQSKQCQ